MWSRILVLARSLAWNPEGLGLILLKAHVVYKASLVLVVISSHNGSED